jgi:hypothetical protein
VPWQQPLDGRSPDVVEELRRQGRWDEVDSCGDARGSRRHAHRHPRSLAPHGLREQGMGHRLARVAAVVGPRVLVEVAMEPLVRDRVVNHSGRVSRDSALAERWQEVDGDHAALTRPDWIEPQSAVAPCVDRLA